MDEPSEEHKPTADEIIEEMAAAKAAEKAQAAQEMSEEGIEGAEDEDVVFTEIETLAAERDSFKDQCLRTLAEFDNYRKRVARDHERMRKTAAESLIRDFLPVLDNLERAIEHMTGSNEGSREGIEMVAKQFREVLANHGVKEIPALGELFDPNVHEAVCQEPSDEAASGKVAREFQKGYRLGDYVLRPSRVSVSMGAPDEAKKDE